MGLPNSGFRYVQVADEAKKRARPVTDSAEDAPRILTDDGPRIIADDGPRIITPDGGKGTKTA